MTAKYDPRPLVRLAALKRGLPLASMVGLNPSSNAWRGDDAPLFTARQIGDLFGVSTETARRWSVGEGDLTEAQADEYATALNEHPTAIWADWPDAPDTKADDEAAELADLVSRLLTAIKDEVMPQQEVRSAA